MEPVLTIVWVSVMGLPKKHYFKEYPSTAFILILKNHAAAHFGVEPNEYELVPYSKNHPEGYEPHAGECEGVLSKYSFPSKIMHGKKRAVFFLRVKVRPSICPPDSICDSMLPNVSIELPTHEDVSRFQYPPKSKPIAIPTLLSGSTGSTGSTQPVTINWQAVIQSMGLTTSVRNSTTNSVQHILKQANDTVANAIKIAKQVSRVSQDSPDSEPDSEIDSEDLSLFKPVFSAKEQERRWAKEKK